jgi:hypothetical protein
MRLVRRVLIALSFAAALPVAVAGAAHAQAPICSGNTVIDHAPYTCTDTKDISGITFSIVLNVDAAGQAIVDFTMDPPQQTDIPIAVHSYTDINQDPRQFINGTIPAGETTGQIIVPRIECGQLDIKAVDTRPGVPEGRIAGPQVTWGDVCQTPATTTTTTTIPVTVSPTSAVAPTTLPPTGSNTAAIWKWTLPIFALAAVLILVSRFGRRPDAEHGS